MHYINTDDVYTNLCMAVLADASQDKGCKLWQDFIKAVDITCHNIDVFANAEWYVGWMRNNSVAEYCLSVRDKDVSLEGRGKKR